MKRFWDKVSPEPNTGCWLWMAFVDREGYGTFFLDKKNRKAHRIAFFLTHGRWPEPCCCHRCDNPSCVRPDHLWEGTNTQNLADRNRKGRQARQRGEAAGNAKLTATQVQEIRERAATGSWGIQAALAKEYGVGKMQISRIVSGENWKEAA